MSHSKVIKSLRSIKQVLYTPLKR